MANKIILVAETGSDMSKELAEELGVILIPMHVCMGDTTLDDGTFPPEEICGYYDRTGKIPTTSGSTIYDFESVYEQIFENDPNAQILHLAYSAITTCSYHSSELALENKAYKNNVRLVDTKQVSVGQCAVVSAVAAWLKTNPEATLEEAAGADREQAGDYRTTGAGLWHPPHSRYPAARCHHHPRTDQEQSGFSGMRTGGKCTVLYHSGQRQRRRADTQGRKGPLHHRGWDGVPGLPVR